MGSRDEFSKPTIETLRLRVSGRCSNPSHRVPTSGPTNDPKKRNVIGKAAHICAAAKGGARFDAAMTSAQRKDIENGIWLCANCADMIDRDSEKYSVDLLLEWKKEAERRAESELGVKLPSEQDVEIYKAVALRLPGKSLISQAIDIVCGDLEAKDPRFSVEAEFSNGKTKFTLNAREVVPLVARVSNEFRKEFAEKFQALFEHGEPLRIESKAIKFSGSKLLEALTSEHGKIEIATTLHKAAVQKVVFEVAGSEVYELDNILGSVTVGSKTLSFSGEAYGGVLEMQYRYPWKDHEGQLNCDVHFSIRFAPWIGKPVSQLPYLDKLLKCFDLGQNAATINLMLEIDGLQVLTAAGGALFKDQDSIDLFVLLRYLRNIRDILSVLNIGMIFTDGFKVSVDELQLTEETWQMLVELKKRRGNDLGDVTCVIEPTNNEEVANMSNGLASDKPMPYRLEQRLARHLNVFGKRIDCGLIRIDYSAMQMKLKNIEDVILIGRPVALKFVPAKDCVVNVEVIRDPPVVTHR